MSSFNMEDFDWDKLLTEACERGMRQAEFRPLFDATHALKIKKLKTAIAERLQADFDLSFAPYSDYTAIPLDNLLPYAHQQLDVKYPTVADKRKFLETIAPKLGYEFDSERDNFNGVAHQLLDATVNTVIIQQLLDTMQLDAQETSSLTPVRLNTKLLGEFKEHYDKKRDALAESYANAMAEVIADASGGSQKPIYLISIGGAEGNLDKEMCDKLQPRLGGRRIHVVNVDPYCPQEDFVLDATRATLVNDVPVKDEALLAKRINEIIPPDAIRIVGCARALHHTGLSLGSFDRLSEKLCSDAVLLMEHPIDDKYRESLPDKTIRLMNEIVANFAFYGTSWMHSSEEFRVQFFQDKELRQHCDFPKEGVPGTNIYATVYAGKEDAAKQAIDDQRPQLLIPVGIPNSGKSSWIKEFTANSPLQWQVISLDAIHEQYAQENGITYRDTFDPEIMKALREQYTSVIQQALKTGANVIIDETNVSKAERKAILEMADDCGVSYHKRSVIFPVRPRVSKNRDLARDEIRVADGLLPRAIPEAYIRERHSLFEKPELSEGFDDVRWMGHGLDHVNKAAVFNR